MYIEYIESVQKDNSNRIDDSQWANTVFAKHIDKTQREKHHTCEHPRHAKKIVWILRTDAVKLILLYSSIILQE